LHSVKNVKVRRLEDFNVFYNSGDNFVSQRKYF